MTTAPLPEDFRQQLTSAFAAVEAALRPLVESSYMDGLSTAEADLLNELLFKAGYAYAVLLDRKGRAGEAHFHWEKVSRLLSSQRPHHQTAPA